MSRHLIILPCHSIWTPGATLGESRDEWSLVSFQIEGYDHLCFKDHILKSLNILEQDKDATLIISGGQTKQESGPISEALSYYQLATKLTNDIELVQRINTEEFARDSFENVLFSLCRYFELHEAYPEKITIVGFEFKRQRFLENHLKQALSFSRNVNYVGNAPTPKDLDEEGQINYFQDLEQQEYKHAVSHFEKDWYSIRSPLLDKKMKRDPFSRYHGYCQSNPKLAKFLVAISDQENQEENLRSNESIQSLLTDFT
ncbi:DEHA2A04752p [Debaryomyces hansenii CBS767]|uniref:DEHA2A04752p n=1 Tax=Debaryomyces hansenii (strain ATCC 36239 / CBS 767 / BCRC 21394 / JCM 1990 / NBRC 0083 / IGC 2968) TaxID=284592 RepID=Q6BZ41_DEBHA|nr:DEHA2A04752p [Debaryomyces hansenii CBS767]CAG84483.2 DEHA2A04752p [Debaryomyces hansenii CBS767]|eukprot:XP_456528.2 DEHA2A04752p [Debaryomyces hansenii CBS767]